MTERMLDPHRVPQTRLSDRLRRAVWAVVYSLLFRFSPRPLHGWRSFLLRCFGARLGPNCHIYPKARIWAPWNLVCGDVVAIADEVIVYNPRLITLGSHAIISQQAYLCGATHNYDLPEFPMVSSPISVGSYAWVCARAAVQPGVSVGEGAVLGFGSIATRDLEPWSVYAGIPARRIKNRVISHEVTKRAIVNR
jgi:putative colanic acid biosynthesis acetyltransferase WcaF